MFFNYDNLEDGSQQPNAWYYPRRHDYFTYNTETTGLWPEYPSMTCTGENLEFFTRPNAYTPVEENNSNYDFSYPEIRFNCMEGKNRKTSWIPNGYPPSFTGPPTEYPDGYYSGLDNGSQLLAISPVVATCPKHYGAYVGKRSTFWTGTNFQKTIVLEVTQVGEEPDDTCLLRIAAAPQNVSPSPSTDPAQYTTKLNDSTLAPDMDIKFPFFFPEIESNDVSGANDAPPYDSTYLEWIRDNCIMYTFTQDGIAGISAVTLQGHGTSSRRQYRAVTWSNNTPSEDVTKRTSPWNNVERLIGNDSLKQLGILEDYIASEPTFGAYSGKLVAVSGDSGRGRFLHIPELTGTSPILVGQVGTEATRGHSNTMHLPEWNETVLEYHTTASDPLGYIYYLQRWILKSQLYALAQWSDTTPSSYGGGGTKDPFQGEILQWMPLPDGRWDLSGIKITTSYDDVPHDGPDNAWSPVPVLPTYEGWNLQWNTVDNIFHSVSDMIDEVPTFAWESAKYWLADFKDVADYQWWPPVGSTWLTRPERWESLQQPGVWDDYPFDSSSPYSTWLQDVLARGGTKFTWDAALQKWNPRSYYTWRHQNWWAGSATITDDTDPGFSDGKTDYAIQDYWCDYKNRSGLIPVWDDTLYQSKQDPETEDPLGCFILEPPLHREVLLNADKDALERPDPWDEDGDPYAYAPVLGWLDGALRLIKPSLGDIGTVLITGTPRSGTVLKWDISVVWDPEEDPGAWVPNRYASGEEAWARDTYSVDMSYNTIEKHSLGPGPDSVDGVYNLGDNIVRDIYIPNNCTMTGYKIFDFSELIFLRQQSNPYLEPQLNTTNDPDDHADHVSHPWMPCSAIPPVGNELVYNPWTEEFDVNYSMMEYFPYPDTPQGDLGHYICVPVETTSRPHVEILYSMKLNIYHIRPYWGDVDEEGESDHPGTVTTIATGVSYDTSGVEWISTGNIELLKGDLIRVELDTSYQESPSLGDYTNSIFGTDGMVFSHPQGLAWEHGNIGPEVHPWLWDIVPFARQNFAKTSFHIKLTNLEGVL